MRPALRLASLVVLVLVVRPGFIGVCPAWAQPAETASVLVATIVPHRGAVPDTVTAYGTAVPGPGATTTLSIQHEGQVQELFAGPGIPVRTGAKLLTFSAAPATVLAYDQAVAALNLARQERAHTAQLLAQQLATRSQLAQSDKAVADAGAALAAQRREGGGTAVQTLTVPFDGIVTAVLIKPGDRVAAGAPLLTLARGNGVVVSVGAEPSQRAKLRPGQAVTLKPLDGGGPVKGTVRQVDAMLDPTTRQIGVAIDVAPGSVLSGASFRADIVVGQFQGWPVPRDAVLSDGKGAHVFQVVSGKAHRVDVQIVGTFGQTTMVEGAIEPKRPLVTEGNYQLTDDEFVREQPANAASTAS